MRLHLYTNHLPAKYCLWDKIFLRNNLDLQELVLVIAIFSIKLKISNELKAFSAH